MMKCQGCIYKTGSDFPKNAPCSPKYYYTTERLWNEMLNKISTLEKDVSALLWSKQGVFNSYLSVWIFTGEMRKRVAMATVDS